jgi:hypothetical protein
MEVLKGSAGGNGIGAIELPRIGLGEAILNKGAIAECSRVGDNWFERSGFNCC